MTAPPGLVVRTPGSSANLGAGFDVFGMAVDLYADLGLGEAPHDAHPIDDHHPARIAFHRLGGSGPVWMRTNIPMARGLGFSGAVRVGAAALAVAQSGRSIAECDADIIGVAGELEGHGDNAAASLHGGVVAWVQGRAIPFRVGPVLGGAAVVAWVPDVTTSTDASRLVLADVVDRADAVHNIGRATQFALAFAHDDPTLLVDATSDLLHQASRLPRVPGAVEAMEAGAAAGAWCSWLSGSGPTVALFAPVDVADAVAAALPRGGHTKLLSIDPLGARVL
ncbi:MAG: hypothetical protein ABJH68_06595 [Ilumatobacter sp.]|uniref:homoserine kinase n=1 Tax=Ilumatobacter sp. TaxID=1967498 RepID=UPI003299C366